MLAIDQETQKLIDVVGEINSLKGVIEAAETRMAALLSELRRLSRQVGQAASDTDPTPDDGESEESDDDDSGESDDADRDDRAGQMSVSERVRLYYMEHPTAVMSAGDLHKAGVAPKLKGIRQALQRLTERKILIRQTTGLYALGADQGKSLDV